MVRLRDILARLDAMNAELQAIAQAVQYHNERTEARATAAATNAPVQNARGKSPQERHRRVQ